MAGIEGYYCYIVPCYVACVSLLEPRVTLTAMETSVWTVFLYASLTAVATGIGALPFFVFHNVSKRTLGLANAAAAGLMLSASFQLIYEGLNYSALRTVMGMLIGLVAIVISRKLIAQRGEPDIAELQSANAVKALLIIGVMTAHSFAEGVGVGVAFGGGNDFGVFITAAIALHNVPEGLAISLVLVPRGSPVWKAAMWSVISSVPQPLMAVPAFLFVQVFEPFLPVGLGLAAGAMIWMAASELFPDALENAPANSAAITTTLAVAAMTLFQVWLG